MDNRNPKLWARVEPDLRDWYREQGRQRWPGNQSEVVRAALTMYRAVVERDLEAVVSRLVGGDRREAA